MDIHGFFQALGQALYTGFTAFCRWIGWVWMMFCMWFDSLPLPNAIKFFSNDTMNRYLFFGAVAYILLMNIWAFYLFGMDKASAKRKDRRVKESRLFKVCFWGGALGGMLGMNVFRHKTLKKKFSVGVPLLFIFQLVFDSFILGFLGFWTFF